MAILFPIIQGIGSYLPEEVVTNAYLETLVDTSDEWIMSRTGIRERRRASREEATSHLGLRAARQALEQAGVEADALDLIIFATVTPDTHCPSAACWLQGMLGAPKAVAFDVTAACSGFLFALSVAEQYLKTGAASHILVVAAETMTRVLDYTDRGTCVLFGDGAGAAVLGRGPEDAPGRILGTFLHSDGSRGDLIQVPGGGSRIAPLTPEVVAQGLHWVQMNGRETFKLAVRAFAQVCQEALDSLGFTVDQVDCFVPHQANMRILHAVCENLGIPEARTCNTIERYGNMASATVPVGLVQAVEEGSLKRGDLAMLAAFGGGLTWGSTLVRW